MHEIMTIEEVAAYLRISERTVYDWAQKGELPGGKLGTTWRFKRQEIENWVNDRLSAEKPQNRARGATTSAILTAERVILRDTASKQDILESLVDVLAETPFIRAPDALLDGILAREKLMSTGIGLGIAVPHVRMDSVTDLVMAAAVCKEAISDYVSLDGAPVQIVCMLAARTDQHSQYIRTLSSISAHLHDPLTRERIISSEDPAFIHHQLTS